MEEDTESNDNSLFLSHSVANELSEFESKSYNSNDSERKSRPKSLSISWSKDSFENQKVFSPALHRWFKAVSKISRGEVSIEINPWKNFPIGLIKAEKAIRYRYSALKRKWVEDEAYVKLENLPFDHGAMRECFRLKKKSTQVNHENWIYASNYVAKRYIKDVKRDTYFEDVKLQMESKLWAEEYNRQNPPKKIDIFQLSVIELVERENKPLYHIEHFMEGNYRKYNSNSGFVDDGCIRNTPQAFSHFTFERSGHRMMVVDIQGVGDLYTDPQIHTADGQNYGDGNLGLRGMALFFSSHTCNPICHFLGLSEFDVHSSEMMINECLTNDIINNNNNDFDEVKMDENNQNSRRCNSTNIPDDLCSISNISVASGDVQKRQRSISFKMPGTVVRDDRASPTTSCSPAFLDELFPAPLDLIRAMSVDSGVLSGGVGPNLASSQESLAPNGPGPSPQPALLPSNSITGCSRIMSLRRRQRNYSDGSDIDQLASLSMGGLEDHISTHYWLRENQNRPSCADHPKNLDQEIGQSILAQIHHEMARLYESGRILRNNRFQKAYDILHHHFWAHLVPNKIDDSDNGVFCENIDTINWQACLFHERHAAQLGCLEAVITLARYGLDMGDHMFQDCPFQLSESDKESGLEYLWRAADSGDRRSMIELANRYRMGCSLVDEKCENEEDSAVSNTNNNSKLLQLNKDWSEATKWYRRAFEAANKLEGQLDARDAEGKYDAAGDLMEPYEILGVMASLYMEGGHGLEQDCSLSGDLYSEAAQLATNAMKGRQAAKFYELADAAYSMMDE